MKDMKRYERRMKKKGYQLIAGVDEVGRGSLAGPVVACALILPTKCRIPGLNDSKKLTPKKREELYPLIKRKALAIGLGRVGERKIDGINILKATHLAMKRAISHLGTRPDLLLVDGFKIPGVEIPQEAIIRGDEKSASIAAASIIAKVTRDRLMVRCHKRHPEYGFHRHKGYGTERHIRALKRNGPSRIHRRTFSGVRI
ncbi:ribonuclease HII [bacterium]|nr:ribonuclease HII [bacterium]MCG2676595.1 ribonuclease HII [bacterium]MCG2677079.1 ribonuclease HII [bacterium]